MGMCVCMSATLRSNISETKGDRESFTVGSLQESGQGQLNGDMTSPDVTDDVT